MPSPYLKTLANELGMNVRKLEIPWKRAKEITIETFGKPEEAFGNTEYKYAMDTVRSMLGLSEDSPMLPTNFLKSDKSANEYLETLTSGQFDIGHVFVSDRGEPVERSIADDETDSMEDVGTDYPNPPANGGENTNYEDDEFGLTGPKTADMYAEGMNYGDKRKSEDDPTDMDDFLGLDGRPKYVERVGGEPFPDNLHADEGEPLQDREPNESGNYKVDTVVVWDETRDDETTVQPWNEEKDDYGDKAKRDADKKADADKKKADADKKTQDVKDKQRKDKEDRKESILDEVEEFLNDSRD